MSRLQQNVDIGLFLPRIHLYNKRVKYSCPPNPNYESPFDDLASLNTTLKSTTFRFDNNVINSKAYRAAIFKSISQQQLNQSSVDIDIRSLLKAREEESIRIHEQIWNLSRTNEELSANLKRKEKDHFRRGDRIVNLNSDIEAATKREAKLTKGLF